MFVAQVGASGSITKNPHLEPVSMAKNILVQERLLVILHNVMPCIQKVLFFAT